MLTIIVVSVLMVASATVILNQRRSPQATLAWLLFLVFIPYLAIPLFAALGFRKRLRPNGDAPNLANQPAMAGADAPQIERLLCDYGLGVAVEGNRFTLITDGQDAWRELLALVEGAERSIDVILYILGKDDVGLAFCDVLERKAQGGVAVRVVLDSVGSLSRPRAALDRLAAAGAEIQFYSPLLHGPGGGRLNLRNHRKMVIADNASLWAGGRNVGQMYLGPEPLEGRWQDLSYRIDGPATQSYAAMFQSDWTNLNGQMPATEPGPVPTDGQSTLQLVPAGPDVPEDPLHDALVYACHAARTRLWIATPYFLPTTTLAGAIGIAARRGVDVRLAIPAKSNQHLADLARGAWLRDLAHAGCHIHLFGEMLHAKAVLADDIALVGSANLDARSLMLNCEMMTLLYSAPDVAQLRDWLDGLYRQTPEGLPPTGLARRSVEGLFRLGSPVL